MNYSNFIKKTVLFLLTTSIIGCSVKQGRIQTKTGIYDLEVKKLPGRVQDPIIYGTIRQYKSGSKVRSGFVEVDNELMFKADTAGKFKFSLKPGRHSFIGGCYAYDIIKLQTFNLVRGDSIKIDIYLNRTKIWLE